MANQSRFPYKDSEFNLHVNFVFAYLKENRVRLLLTPAANNYLTELDSCLNDEQSGWNTMFLNNYQKAISNSTICSSKSALRSRIEELLRDIYDDIPKSVLTEADRNTLNLKLPSKSKTRVAIPTEAPGISLHSSNHLIAHLIFRASGNTRSRALPAGVMAIEIESAYLPYNATPGAGFPSEKDFRHLDSTGRRSYTRFYTPEMMRGIEYLRVRYLNTRKEPGPWSQVMMLVVA